MNARAAKKASVMKRDTAVMALHNSAALRHGVSPVPDESVTPADSGRPDVMHPAPRACSVQFGACLPIPVLDDRIYGATPPTTTHAHCRSSISACQSARMSTDVHENLVPLHELPVAGAAAVQAPADCWDTVAAPFSLWLRPGR
ncbi:hypothetical protein B0H14DRAFT_2631889 [Mycena olivaceomarginata]|nr:hypothetical protein B0H14DRAFT_2631889 [Mycena olivaceomarginata]